MTRNATADSSCRHKTNTQRQIPVDLHWADGQNAVSSRGWQVRARTMTAYRNEIGENMARTSKLHPRKTSSLARRDFLKWSLFTTGALTLPMGCDTPIPEGTDGGAPPPLSIDPELFDDGTPSDFQPTELPEDRTRFPLAMQSGSAQSTAATVWGYASDMSPLRLRVWRPREDGRVGVILVTDVVVTPSPGGAYKHRVSSLAPATQYNYAYFVEDGDGTLTARSAIGQFRTAHPEEWQQPFTIACATCTNLRNAPFRALEKMTDFEFDAICHLGDMSYNDGAVTPDEYREKWRATLADPGYQALLPKASSYIAWDDHEFTNNFNPETLAPERLAAARDAFFEMLPAEPGEDGQLWQRYRWGITAEVIVLDCRSERRPSTRNSDSPIYIGETQMAWLKETLQSSPCHFKIVLNSVPMTRMPSLWGFANDRWQGYDTQRAELLRYLEENDIDNVWFLSGDFHVGFVARLEQEGYARRLWEVAVGPSGNQGNPLAFLAEQEQYREDVFPSAQFEYGKGDLAGTLLTFDPQRDEVRIRFISAETGEPLFDKVLSRST